MLLFIAGSVTGSIAMLFTLSLTTVAKRADEHNKIVYSKYE
ncbi:hypothetical protein OEV98_05685 [Caldibacillus lycopersici]|uniref:DUF3789 domain-containing protein n=1 Tax=Perspicuibacillus lycopersici TaxID=1325689 RepID=A0AAE3IR40_9BACI|nr:hypothetical protein [Perspicuibacillus lycopersici]MCU9613040.1 hypothetical protein [Perspicuibacillus lycopersici]